MIFVDIKGEINNEVQKFWAQLWGEPREVFSVETIRAILKAHPDDPDLFLNIDCNGGDVEEGFKIYDELRNSGKNIHTNISGGCHSMAVVLLLAAPAENRSANRNCRALIHKVYAPVYDFINADDAEDVAAMLRMEQEAILDVYVDRTGNDRATMEQVMAQEKTHNAQSLLELGFISKINSYNTNQLFNKMAKETKTVSNAFQSFMDKVNAFRNKKAGKPANFDYLDADGNVVLSTVGDEDNLAEGVEATLSSGETSGTVTLEDGRVVTVTDGIVTEIEEPETGENLEERVRELEELLEDATNLAQEQQETINALETELNNFKGSNYQPKPRRTQVPDGKNGKTEPTVEDLKAAARAAQEKVKNAKNLKK